MALGAAILMATATRGSALSGAESDQEYFHFLVAMFAGGFVGTLVYPQFFFLVPFELAMGQCLLLFVSTPVEGLGWPIGFLILNVLLHCSAWPAYLGAALAFGLFLVVRWGLHHAFRRPVLTPRVLVAPNRDRTAVKKSDETLP